jgi:ubiquinone/menaquinone biosynthesis C-methylase UbiE
MGSVDYFLELQTKTGWGRVLSRFVDWIAPQTGWQTLDIGCGPGMLPALLAARDCHAFGVDLNPSIFSPQLLHRDVDAANTLCLPFPSGRFHLVTDSNVLLFLSEPQRALGEMRRVLRHPGQVAIPNLS